MGSFVDREQAAKRKQKNGDDKGPKKRLPAVPEWVLGSGRSAGALLPDQKQNLIRAIHHAMNALRKESRAARDKRAHKLCSRDAQIREKSKKDHFFRTS